MAVLKLLGRRVLSDSEITLCGYLSERSKWKFPGLWPTVSFRSKSLWAWGVRGAQNFKLFSPGEFWVILKSHSVATCLRGQSGNSLVYDQLVSFRSKSLWAWGVRGAQNFKLLSPGGRGHQVPCMYHQLCANHSTCNHDNKPQRVRVDLSFRWDTWGSERRSNVINAINKLEFEARFAWYQSRNLFSLHSFSCCS